MDVYYKDIPVQISADSSDVLYKAKSQNIIEYVGRYDDKGIWSYGAGVGGIRDDTTSVVFLFKVHDHGDFVIHLGKEVKTVSVKLYGVFYKDSTMLQNALTPAYGEEGWYKSFQQLGNYYGASHINVPDDAEYLALSIPKTSNFMEYIDADGAPMLILSKSRVPYEPYEIDMVKGAYLPNNLKNKTLYWFGDSIIAGLYCNSPISKKMDDMYGTVSQNHAVSNTTFYEGQIANQVNNAYTEEPDVVVFDGGANDTNEQRFGTWHSAWDTNAGTISDTAPSLTGTYGTDTVLGGFETFIQNVKNKFPTTKIVFVATHFIGSNHKYKDQKECFDAFAIACKKWGVSVVDIHNGGNINSFLDNTFTSNGSYPDNTHPTDATHYKYYIPMIASKLREILPD